MISIIVAISEENAIGKQGGLLCHLPNDLKHFKTVTSGSTVIMGERTFLSLPINKTTGTHALPNRRNIVITDNKEHTFDGAEMAYSIEDAIKLAQENSQLSTLNSKLLYTLNSKLSTTKASEAFVIGGGMVYRQFMPLADKLYITHIHHSWKDADTFFPEIKESEWQLISAERQEADENNPYPHTFAVYTRRK